MPISKSVKKPTSNSTATLAIEMNFQHPWWVPEMVCIAGTFGFDVFNRRSCIAECEL